MILKKMCSRLGWLVLLLQLLGSTVAGNAAVQADGPAVGCLPLPPEPVCFSIAAPGQSNPQYLDIILSGVITPGAAVTNGLYAGFCVDEIGGIIPTPPPGFCGITLRYLSDPATALIPYIPAKIISNVSAINWILNHRGSTRGGLIEEAIWAFTDGSTEYLAAGHEAAKALVDGALANPGYVPAPGERQAVLLDGGAAWNTDTFVVGNITYHKQWMVIEVICPVPSLACTVGPQSAQTICSGGSATFMASASGGVAPFTYVWSGPGSFSSTDASITVSAAGTYTVVVSDSSKQSSTCTAVLTVLAPLTVTVNDAEICLGDAAVLTATPSEAGVTYLWSPGGATTQSITVSPSSKAFYSVEVTKGDCKGSNIGTVFVNLPPSVSFQPVSTCPGTTVSLVPTVSANVVGYLWSTGATTPGIDASPLIPTTYTLTVTSDKGCKATASITVGVYDVPTVSLGDATVCGGEAVTLTPVVSANVASYSWTTGDTTPTITDSPVSTRSYTVTVYTINGCSASATATVTVKAPPTASVRSAVICQGESATLTVTTDAGAGATYLWSNGATTPSITVKPTVDTAYSVTVTSATKCSVLATATVSIGNCICVVQADPDSRCTSTAGHAIYLPGIGTDFVFLTPAKFIDNLDGTARLVGTAVSKTDATKIWLVDVVFTGYTTTAPAGSPKKELSSNAYKPYGPIDPTTWAYYTDFTGTLTGQGKYAGAVLTIADYMAAFQVGVGANGKNTHYGASGWFTVTVTHQPTTGAALSCTTHGDFNVDFVDCNPQTPVKGLINGKVVCADNNSPLAGVLVTLKDSNGKVVATKTTDASGNYKFENLDPGSYTVSVPSTSGGLAVSGSSSKVVTIVAAGTGAANFAYKGGLISGYVFCDANGNCLKDTGDDVLSGIKVSLIKGYYTIATATTDANGYYEFKGCLPAGCYTVKVASCYNGQSIVTTNPLTVNLTAGQESKNNNFGYKCQCVYTCTYWKCHTCDWSTCSLTIGGKCYTKCQIVSLMGCSQNVDKSYSMFCQLVACKLNVLNGCKSSGICDTITAGDNWIKKYGVGKCIKSGTPAWNEGSAICAKLESYCNGGQGAPKCN